MTPGKGNRLNRGAIFFLYVLVLAVYCAPGIHEPWRADEAYAFGMTYHVIQTGDWIVPTLAGEPFMEKPPLFYITSSLFARWFSFLLPLHDAARLVASFYMALILLFTGLSARRIYGPGGGWGAALLLISCVGLFEFGHQMLIDMALLAGCAVAMYGFVLGASRPALGGVLAGVGLGIGFMSKGLLGPGIIGLTALLLPLFHRPWRGIRFLFFMGLGALPWLVVWPAVLWFRDPELFATWFWVNNWGRYFGANNLGPRVESMYYVSILGWFCFPAWPLAVWTLWRHRHDRAHPLWIAFIYFATILFALSASSDGRQLYALPLLLPLAVLGEEAVPAIGRFFNRLTVAVFGVALAALWMVWVALQTGHPAWLALKLTTYQPGYDPVWNGWTLVVAAAGTLLWLGCVVRFRQGGRDALLT